MKLGLIAQNSSSPSSFYRGFGVWPYLAREKDIELIIGQEWDWSDLARCDALFMHSPVTGGHAALADLCRRTKTPLWIDFDDHLFALDRSNQGYDGIMRPEVHASIRACISRANLVTVSTPELQRQMCPAAKVIPNALNDYLWSFSDAPREKVITWRGGPTHHPDLARVLPVLARVAKAHPDWQWHFLGCVYWGLDKEMPKGSWIIHPWSDLIGYFETLTNLRPTVHLVPMEDTPFNRCKSNCSWIEATAAGAAVVAPTWDEWKDKAIYNYDGLEDFEACLNLLIDDASRPAKANQLSRGQVPLLSRINEQRWTMLQELVRNHRSK